jgi:hypothetical protein
MEEKREVTWREYALIEANPGAHSRADALVFGPEFIGRIEAIADRIPGVAPGSSWAPTAPRLPKVISGSALNEPVTRNT